MIARAIIICAALAVALYFAIQADVADEQCAHSKCPAGMLPRMVTTQRYVRRHIIECQCVFVPTRSQ